MKSNIMMAMKKTITLMGISEWLIHTSKIIEEIMEKRCCYSTIVQDNSR